jgi:hypothetical protein
VSQVERLAVSDRGGVDVMFRRQGAVLGLARSGHHRTLVVPDLEELLPRAVPGLAAHPVKRGARADAGDGVEALGLEEETLRRSTPSTIACCAGSQSTGRTVMQRARAATFAAILVAVSAFVIALRSIGGQ